MQVYVLFNGIAIISGRCDREGGNKDCVQWPVFGYKDFQFKRVLNPGPLDVDQKASA